MTVESLLLAATQVSTFDGASLLTRASGFFFARDERMFLVTSRHVLIDEPNQHFPDRIEIELHVDEGNLAISTGYSILLYREGQGIWRQGADSGGEIDVAAIELDRDALPDTAVMRAFTADHLPDSFADIDVGSPLLIVGFPLGFHDTLHHLPVVRQAVIASSFGLRFQGQGAFLTDGRTHRGTSGAPVVMRAASQAGSDGGPHEGPFADLPWRLLGVHSARLDMGTRDAAQDESLGLNLAWYADILLTLTSDPADPVASADPVDSTPPPA
ncbi:MAG TPA: trypsin-like peptidase domain-containing protein [Burkholderiaceae bacterium]|nr:trypsin-like peptidase domain-containing protein [Burkholderiaceae bacterium]